MFTSIMKGIVIIGAKVREFIVTRDRGDGWPLLTGTKNILLDNDLPIGHKKAGPGWVHVDWPGEPGEYSPASEWGR